MSTKETFGAFTRREREAKQIGLRKMAKMIDVSPTYLSKIERDQLPPPAEDKVVRIAEVIQCDRDRLLALANRVSSDVLEILKRHPSELSAALRKADELAVDMMDEIIDIAKKAMTIEMKIVSEDEDYIVLENDEMVIRAKKRK